MELVPLELTHTQMHTDTHATLQDSWCAQHTPHVPIASSEFYFAQQYRRLESDHQTNIHTYCVSLSPEQV